MAGTAARTWRTRPRSLRDDRRTRGRNALALCLLAAWPLGGAAHAEPAESSQPSLAQYLSAMAESRLIAIETGSEAQLTALVAEGERLFLDGRYDAASTLLLEAVESPRFADFHDFDAYVAAEHMAGAALTRLGSLKTARRYLQRVIARGPGTQYYAPGVRRYVDVALTLGDFQAAADFLERGPVAIPEDAKNELRYLRARAAEQAGNLEQAAAILAQIGKRSRFHANAQYLLGVFAARERRYGQAEQRFCAVAGQGSADSYGFYVDDRFFEVLDLARLALGRTAHERRRGNDAFYYYFQVPQDSPRLSSALFEAAWASYESDDHDTAVDLLEQLDARFPESAYADEAAVLRGYVSLARCDFEHADQNFVRFTRSFAPLDADIERLLDDPVRRDALYEDLLLAEGGTRARDARRRMLLGLLRVDPEFYRLHAEVKRLDAEAARAGRLRESFAAIAARLQRGDRPHAAAALAPEQDRGARLERELELALMASRSLGEQIDALRAAGGSAAQLAAADQQSSALARRVHALSERVQTWRSRPSPAVTGTATAAADATDATADKGLGALLRRDAADARELPARVAALRGKLVRAANDRALRALRELHLRLRGLLRGAGIGRVDAVMGSKRRIESQIESLAAGRFPAELRDPLLVQGLLSDDEEYWPFQGEDWPDEYQEHYESSHKPAAAAALQPAQGASP